LTLYKQDNKKVGFTVSKKIGNAVKRNRAKRRLRALFSEFSGLIDNGTYVFIAKESINRIDYKSLKNDFRYSLKKLRVLK
jgi:ribonuclease P protein component